MRFHDRTAIVTGASMGIGAATALSLAQRGVTVYAAARSADKLEVLASRSPRIIPVVADVTIEEDRARLVSEAGDTDILVNNAGLASYGLLESISPDAIRHMFELNVMALIDLSQRVLPAMLLRGSGHICNVGSSISHVAAPPMTIYAATKFAVEGFSDGLRREVINRGVGVSLIQPGPVKTAFWDRAATGDRPDVDQESGFGIPAQWVANAIVKAIRFDRVPGFATIAVPRAVGLGRILDIPGISYALDWGQALAQKAPMAGVSKSDTREDADVIPMHKD
jgi:short-subunit dehydrogenase